MYTFPEVNQSVINGVKVYNKNHQVIEVGDKLEILGRKLKLFWWIDDWLIGFALLEVKSELHNPFLINLEGILQYKEISDRVPESALS